MNANDISRDAARLAILKAANPWANTSEENALLRAAKNARKELAAAFPAVKFSVRVRRYSGGNAMDVAWDDGPTSEQVDSIVDKYAAGYFSGMDDSYTYVSSGWVQCFGSARYVMTYRRNSDRAIESAIRTAWARWGESLAAIGIKQPTVGEYSAGLLRSVGAGAVVTLGDDLASAIDRIASRRTWALPVRLLASFPKFEAVSAQEEA